MRIYSFESQNDEEHPCFGFISLSLMIVELSKKRHYFPALVSTFQENQLGIRGDGFGTFHFAVGAITPPLE